MWNGRGSMRLDDHGRRKMLVTIGGRSSAHFTNEHLKTRVESQKGIDKQTQLHLLLLHLLTFQLRLLPQCLSFQFQSAPKLSIWRVSLLSFRVWIYCLATAISKRARGVQRRKVFRKHHRRGATRTAKTAFYQRGSREHCFCQRELFYCDGGR